MTVQPTTDAGTYRVCPHCGGMAIHMGPCPNIKAIEYHPDGSIKRVEYR